MYLLCAAIAIPLGIVVAKSTRAYETIFAVLQVAASIPATILLPVIVLIFVALPFGNELTALAIIFLAMIWYLLFSVIAGMRTIPEQFESSSAYTRWDGRRLGARSTYPPSSPRSSPGR